MAIRELGHSELQLLRVPRRPARGAGASTSSAASAAWIPPSRRPSTARSPDAPSASSACTTPSRRSAPMATIEAVHSCGHGVIAGSVVAAALALADHRDQLAGKVVVFGLPGRRDPRRRHRPARRRQGHLGRDRPLERDRRRALLAPRVHRHRLARVPLDAPRARAPLRGARRSRASSSRRSERRRRSSPPTRST